MMTYLFFTVLFWLFWLLWLLTEIEPAAPRARDGVKLERRAMSAPQIAIGLVFAQVLGRLTLF